MKIFLSSQANRQLNKLPCAIHNLLITEIEKIGVHPFPVLCKKLTNRAGWRIRVGDYRILYTVDNKKREVTILSVAHRKEAYRY